MREIPRYKEGPRKGDTCILYKFFRADARALGLDNLENGFDSIEMRFWLGHSLARFKEVVIIKKEQKNWYGQVVTYTEESHEDTIKGIITSENVLVSSKNVIPSHGWDHFLENLLTFQITFLPNGDDIAGYHGCGEDGTTFYFEVATADHYRFYYYCNPDEYSGKYWQAKNVLVFASILEKEFGFRYTR